MSRTCDSFWTILGVVPEATVACSPERAPQAMVMKRKGNSDPENTGPSPLLANSVTAGIWTIGMTTTMPAASTRIVPTFMKVDR